MIYLVEDDDNIRKLVCYALEKEGYEIEGFAKPKEFWEKVRSNVPQMVILDVMLPEESGLEILKKLRTAKNTVSVAVIMLTAKDSEFDKVTGLDMGADDYITKPFGMTELISRVGAVLRRCEKREDDNVYVVGDLYVNPQKHIIKVGGEDIDLSFKEYALLLNLLEADGNVVTRKNLLESVWGEFYEESRTLDVHIRKLRMKLKESGEMIKTIKNIGYKLGGEK